jgi:hypothetical protein
LYVVTLSHPFIPAVSGNAMSDLISLLSTERCFQDSVLGQRHRPLGAGKLHFTFEHFHPQRVSVPVSAKLRLAVRRQLNLADADFINVLRLQRNVERGVSPAKGQAIHLASGGSQRELREFQQREFANPGGRAILKFDLGKTSLAGGKLEAFLNGSVRGSGGPPRDVRALNTHSSFSEAEANDAHMGVRLGR